MTETDEKIRSMTIQALRDAQAGFDEFGRRIESCSTAFEDGRDSTAHAELADLVTPLRDFARFCSTVMSNCAHWLPEKMTSDMGAANQKLSAALHMIVAETEDGNEIGIGDALRFDLTEALNEYSRLFPEMAVELEQVQA